MFSVLTVFAYVAPSMYVYETETEALEALKYLETESVRARYVFDPNGHLIARSQSALSD